MLSNSSSSGVHVFDPQNMASCYNLMISTVTPRPIALVSTTNPTTGVDNLAPFSYFGAVAHDPPMLAVGFCRNGKERKLKDSSHNLLETKECAIHIISEWYLDAANHSCGNFAADVDEFQEAGLTKVYDCQAISAKIPRVKEAAVMYECELDYMHHVVSGGRSSDDHQQKPTTEIALLKVKRIHVHDSVLVEGADLSRPAIDTVAKLQPIGRLGGNLYTTVGDIADVPRPKV